MLGNGETIQPILQFVRDYIFGRGEVGAQQLPCQTGLPDQAAALRADGQRGEATGIERAARLAHLAGIARVHGNAGEHFAWMNRLGYVVGATGLETGDDVLGLGEAGHEDDGDVACTEVGLEAARDFEAVHAGHHGIEQDHIRQGLRCTLQGRFAVGGDEHGVAGFVERIVEDGQVLRHIIHDEHEIGFEAIEGRRVHPAVSLADITEPFA